MIGNNFKLSIMEEGKPINARLIEYAIEKMPYSYDSETNRLKLNVEKE